MSQKFRKKSAYPETLFHFCKKLESLKGILSDQAFHPSYAREFVSSIDIKTPYYWVPMVSFCDIKLCELDLHMRNYGSYGIGLSKHWAIKKGLNPVLYMSQGCALFGEVRQALIENHNAKTELDEIPHEDSFDKLYKKLSDSNQKIMKIYSYIKNYQGNLNRKGRDINDFRFADDKEWRYVPEIKYLFWGCNLEKPTVEQLRTKKSELNERNLKDGNHWLKFDYSDIKFIVVPDESKSMNLIKFIEKNSSNLDHKMKVSLISKILIANHLEL